MLGIAMQFWKSLAIGLIVLLVISYVGFAYVYSSSGGFTIAGMIGGGMQPKVITLLKATNITSYWNTSVNTLGYKEGFLYVTVLSVSKEEWDNRIRLTYQFEVDEMRDYEVTFGFLSEVRSDSSVGEIKLTGTKVWFALDPEPAGSISAVISMSLYLRD